MARFRATREHIGPDGIYRRADEVFIASDTHGAKYAERMDKPAEAEKPKASEKKSPEKDSSK